jgi:hypothetical protein
LRFGERQDVKEKKKEEKEVGQRHHTDIPSANLSSAISGKVREAETRLLTRTYEVYLLEGAQWKVCITGYRC